MRVVFQTGRVVYTLKNNGSVKSAVFVDYAPEMRFDLSDNTLEVVLMQDYPVAMLVATIS